MGFALYFIILAIFLVLIVHFRRSTFIFALAIAGWIVFMWGNDIIGAYMRISGLQQ